MLSSVLGLIAGWTDWRWRRIPNWLTVPGLVLGVAVNSWAGGWNGAKTALLGALLGLGLLLPFVLIRSLGAGDWKLAGALGAFLGPERLLAVLFAACLVAGAMAVVLIVWKRRVRQTLRNIWHMLRALLTLHSPGSEVSLENPQALKVPFGVAVAIAVILYTAGQALGRM
jgi:prepilin peptidase CpaA